MPASLLEFEVPLWTALIYDLARVGGGRKESGAFLLGTLSPTRHVTDYLLYADLSPAVEHEDYVQLNGSDMARVWQRCEERGLEVVADVHTHRGGPGQSVSDRQYPIISLAGHVALIVPNYAMGTLSVSDVGVHLFLGNRQWRSYFGYEASRRLIIQ